MVTTEDGLEVTESMYQLVFVMLRAQELKDAGLLAGGPDINQEKMQEIEKLGKEAGFTEPKGEGITEILHSIQGQFSEQTE